MSTTYNEGAGETVHIMCISAAAPAAMPNGAPHVSLHRHGGNLGERLPRGSARLCGGSDAMLLAPRATWARRSSRRAGLRTATTPALPASGVRALGTRAVGIYPGAHDEH